MQENYFRFNLYGDNWSDLAEIGKYVFQNRNNEVGAHNVLAFLVFHFVVDYNLSDLELFFRLAGFSAFTLEEMPDSITNPEVINLTNKKNVHSGWFGGYVNEKDATQYIESKLGTGIITRFKTVKNAQLNHKKVQLYEQIRKVDEDIKNVGLTNSSNNHYAKIKYFID